MQRELPRLKVSQCATGAHDKLKGRVNNSGVLRTEKAASKKEAYTEVERVVVCHGLGDVALDCLTLGALGKGQPMTDCIPLLADCPWAAKHGALARGWGMGVRGEGSEAGALRLAMQPLCQATLVSLTSSLPPLCATAGHQMEGGRQGRSRPGHGVSKLGS